MKFDFLCLVGATEGCPIVVTLLGWANFVKAFLAAVSINTLMRYSEGANFVAIVLVKASNSVVVVARF